MSLLLRVILCGVILAGALAAFGGTASAGYWLVTVEGYAVWDDNPLMEDTATWSGRADAGGYADGQGVLKWFRDNQEDAVFEGALTKGKYHGRGAIRWAPGDAYEGDFVDGKRQGKGVAQIYVAPRDWKKAGWEAPKRLGAFAKADLKPNQSKTIDVRVDPRLLATYEAAGNNWHIRAGEYRLMLGQASDELTQTVSVTLPDSIWSASVTD